MVKSQVSRLTNDEPRLLPSLTNIASVQHLTRSVDLDAASDVKFNEKSR
jgi:hypothetical protein